MIGDFLIQITLYPDGTINLSGSKPDNLGVLLRILADAADAGAISWVGPVV